MTKNQRLISEWLYRQYKDSQEHTPSLKLCKCAKKIDGHLYELIQQNPHSTSSKGTEWREKVKEGHEVVQVKRNYSYIGVYIDGTYQYY